MKLNHSKSFLITNYLFPGPDDIILLGAGVHSMPLVLGEVDEVDPIPGKMERDDVLNFVLCQSLLFAVEDPLLGALLAVVDDYLVVCTRGYDALSIIAGDVRSQHQIRNCFSDL